MIRVFHGGIMRWDWTVFLALDTTKKNGRLILPPELPTKRHLICVLFVETQLISFCLWSFEKCVVCRAAYASRIWLNNNECNSYIFLTRRSRRRIWLP